MHSFQDLEYLENVPLIDLLRFVKNTNWFLWEWNSKLFEYGGLFELGFIIQDITKKLGVPECT